MPGLVKYGDVTLKRGLAGSLDLWNWFDQVRSGGQVHRDVRIELLSEDHAQVVMAWHLRRAFPVKYCGPELDGKGNDVAMEELVLAYERLEVE
jgi:phage tail-like protein